MVHCGSITYNSVALFRIDKMTILYGTILRVKQFGNFTYNTGWHFYVYQMMAVLCVTQGGIFLIK